MKTEHKIKKLEHKIKNLEEKIKKMENVTVGKSIITNIFSWLAIFIAVFCIAPNNYGKGILTFFILFFNSYYLHTENHKYTTLFTIAHTYHHENDNFFSHGIQYFIELGLPFIFLIIYYLFGTIFLDKWVILFSALFYSTIHNINYGYFKVNNVHSLHHKYPMTNFGPDICDIMFGTKHPDNTEVENTNHYIPNIIIITICILLLKRMCLNETFNTLFVKYYTYLLASCFIIYMGFSCFLYLL
jgi:hypothetical protein